MIIKKYVVEEMSQALQKIKEDLGPEAIIVSSIKIRGKGLAGLFKKKLEVTAVLDEIKQLPSASAKENKLLQAAFLEEEPAKRAPVSELPPMLTTNLVRTNPTAVYEQVQKSSYALQPTEFKPLLEDQVMKSLEQEEKERFLNMLEEHLEGLNEDVDKNAARHWLKILTEMDVDQGIADRLIKGLDKLVSSGGGEQPEMAKVALISRVTEMLKSAYHQVKPAKYQVFIGPPGVGKTTTLAKLATRYKLLADKKVVLITVYTYRYGTADQLKVYGDSIDVPVEVVMTPAELAQAVERHADKDYVLIDTVGRTSKNTGQVLELKGFLQTIKEPKDVFLVMSATTKDRDLFRVIRDFKIAHYTGFVFTKTDETETLGSLLNAVVKTGIPVQFVTDGQNIPDDLEELQPRKLSQLIFRSVDPYANNGY